MARKSDGTVYINTLVDTKGFGKGMNTMQKQVNGLNGALGKLGKVIAATFAVGKLVQFGKEAIDLGSDLQEVQNVVDVTFTTMNEQVNEFAKNAAETAGLSETMAKRYTGTFGAMAKAFGFAEGEAFDMSTSLTQLAGDVASFYNLTQDEAYTKLKSVFTGETETLKDLGVVMTQNALDAYAMAEGYGKTTKQMSEQEKVALRYSFVLDQLSAVQGDFVRTSDSWANQTRILNLNFDSFKANIGQALINIFTPFLKVINQIVSKMAPFSAHFVAFSEMLVGKQTSGGGGSPGEALGEIADGYEEIADSTNEATKAQKKYLSGLDEIRTFADNTDKTTEAVGGISGINKLDTGIISAASIELSAFEKRIYEVFDTLESFILNKDWEGLGGYISDGIAGAFDFLSEKISEVDWEEFGEDVGEFISGINWFEVIKSSIKLKISIWQAIADAWFGFAETAPFESALIAGLAAMKFTGAGAAIMSALSSSILSYFATVGGISGFLTLDMVALVGETGWATAGALAGGAFIGGIAASILGFNIGQWLNEVITGEEIDMTWAEQFQVIKESFSDGTWKEALDLWGDDIRKAFTMMGDDIVNWWDDTVVDWYEEEVSPFFSKENWIAAINGVKEAFSITWNAAINGAIELLNKFIDYLNDKMHFEWDGLNILGKQIIPSGSMQLFTIPKIPMLANGAVIPPNAPFMAMLGDQKHGTNIEAPLDTIKQAVREVMGAGGNSQMIHNVLYLNNRVVYDAVMNVAQAIQDTTGRNPYELT